jgi:hypothetical protein
MQKQISIEQQTEHDQRVHLRTSKSTNHKKTGEHEAIDTNKA